MGEILLLKVLILFSFSIDSIFNFMSGKSSQTTEACLCFRPCGALSHRAMPYVNAIAPLGLTKKRGTDHQESLAAGKRCCHDGLHAVLQTALSREHQCQMEAYRLNGFIWTSKQAWIEHQYVTVFALKGQRHQLRAAPYA